MLWVLRSTEMLSFMADLTNEMFISRKIIAKLPILLLRGGTHIKGLTSLLKFQVYQGNLAKKDKILLKKIV